MSSEFLPIKMNRPILAEDSLYSRQNQYGTKQSAVKAGGEGLMLPSNDDLKAKVDTALQMISRNVYPDRGSILNIVV